MTNKIIVWSRNTIYSDVMESWVHSASDFVKDME